MAVFVPDEVMNFFAYNAFEKYPFVDLPKSKKDSRGEILNLVDGKIQDVAYIKTFRNSIRASHFHQNDWHFIFLLKGSFVYEFANIQEPNNVSQCEVICGNFLYTPPLVFHRLIFLEDSEMIVISHLSRTQDNYEKDTIRLPHLTL